MENNLYKNQKSIYCYEDCDILKNKLNIKDKKKLQEYEAKITAAKLLSLRKQKLTGEFDAKHFISIHTYLFEDIYPFAGELRKENIAKGEFRFAEWEYIPEELEKLLRKLKAQEGVLSSNKEKLANELAYYTAELNVLHPFREGNGRTTREFIRQLALKNGYTLNLRRVEPERVLKATIKSIVDVEDLEKVIKECLEENCK